MLILIPRVKEESTVFDANQQCLRNLTFFWPNNICLITDSSKQPQGNSHLSKDFIVFILRHQKGRV